MARMPIGEPRSVPDEAGELYDREMAKLRARSRSQSTWRVPEIDHPHPALTFVPVVGPGWEAAADLQDGDYLGAALNGASVIADLAGAGVVLKGVKAAKLGVGLYNTGSKTADSSRKILRARGLAKAGDEIHHTRALKGLGRNVPDDRNHYMYLKVLPRETHRRLTGSWNGKPQFDPIRRAWHGSTGWEKARNGVGATHLVSGADAATDQPE